MSASTPSRSGPCTCLAPWAPPSPLRPGPGSRMDATSRLAFTLAVVPLVTPYAMTYDMLGPTLAAALMLTGAQVSRALLAASALAWAWPGIAAYVSARYGTPGLGAPVYGALATAIWSSTGGLPPPALVGARARPSRSTTVVAGWSPPS